ncbi:hypothetical protein V8E36_004137 [Tilletia maclaganii]
MAGERSKNVAATEAKNASASAASIPAQSGSVAPKAPLAAAADTSADISMDDADTSTASLAQRMLIRNATEGAPSPSVHAGAGAGAAAAAAAGTRRASTRNSPAPRRPGAVAWKDLTPTFKLGPGASVQSAVPAVPASTGTVLTTVIAPAAAAALDSFATASPVVETTPAATTNGAGSARSTAASRSSTGSSAAASGAPVAVASTSTTTATSGATISTQPNGQSVIIAPRHPNAAFATEVLGPPPRLPTDPFYPPLATTYTGIPPPGSNASSSKAPAQSANQTAPITTDAKDNSNNTQPAAEHESKSPSSSAAPAAAVSQAPAPTSSSSRSKKPLITINQGTDVGHGAGPAVIPSAVGQALGAVANKRRGNRSHKAIAVAHPPRTTRARSLHDSASASPSPSTSTIPLAPIPTPASSTAEGVTLPSLMSSDAASLGKASILGLDISNMDSSSDTESIRDAAGPSSGSGSTGPPDLKKRRITARLARPAEARVEGSGPPLSTGVPVTAEGASMTPASSAAQAQTTVTDDLEAIFGTRRTRSAHRDQADLGSGAESASSSSALSSAPSSQGTQTTPASTAGSVAVSGPPSTSAAASTSAPAPAGSSAPGTPVKRPRITVKRNGVIAPPPPSVLAAAAAAAAAVATAPLPGSDAAAVAAAPSMEVDQAQPAPTSAPATIIPETTADPVARTQTPPLRAGTPAAVTRARRSAGAPAQGPTIIAGGKSSSGSSSLTSVSSSSGALGGSIGPSSGAAAPSASTAMLTRASTPTRTIPPSSSGSSGGGAAAVQIAYPTIAAAAHMSGSPQKLSDTFEVSMTANGTLARAPAAEFAAAVAAGGHASSVTGPVLGGAARLAGLLAAPGEKESNQDFCDACKGHGRFLCCDGCVRSFHFSCISPPIDMDEIADMDDSWFCNICVSAKRPPAKEPKGIFPRLLKQLQQTNPVQYELPADIRGYFKGVGTAADGSYLNVGMIRPLRVNKQGLIEDRDPYKLKDKNGKAVLCYRCGGSSMPAIPHSGDLFKATMATYVPPGSNKKPDSTSHQPPIPTPDGTWRRILSCDFCAAHWHLDCVNPPLAVMPNMTRKWMCPIHAEHAMPKFRVPKSATAIQPYALPLPNKDNIGEGKLYKVRLRNNGDVDIIPDPTDSFFNQDGSTNSASQPGWEEIIIGGVNPNGSGQRFRFRVPEKVVRLDFWNRVKANTGPVSVRFGKPHAATDPVFSLDDLADVAMERLKKEELLRTVETTGTDQDKATVKLVSKVFKDDRDEGRQDHPPTKSQREFEEAIERARVHGVVSMQGGILLSKLADPPTVLERSTAALVDEPDHDDDVAPKQAQPETAVKIEDVSTALGLLDGPEQGSNDVTMADLDPARLALPPLAALPGSRSRSTNGRSISGDSEHPSSPASTLTDLSSDDGGGELSDDDEAGGAGPAASWSARQKTAKTLDLYGLKESDLERLSAIQDLIKVKGEAAMLEFLLSK